MIRIAAIGDLHCGGDSPGVLRRDLDRLSSHADILLLAGDLTLHGEAREAKLLADEIEGAGLPMIAVLGNHDYHLGSEADIRKTMENAGVCVLEGTGVSMDIDGTRLSVAGTKGFGGGFAGACGSDFGEPEMKAFIRHTKGLAARLEEALARLDGDVRIALLHYSPTETTLQGERLEIYPFMGSYLLGDAIDRAGANLVLHGHAHNGNEEGVTSGGIPVRNVAQPVIGHPYMVYPFD
ncbi:MAG: metallophosphoesterase family protein [Actinobacteria bacterium]|nr:metallophosphoesterase family protein [Actinomycetota bacterium]